jgi:molybdopterin synthase catalytic subunit
VFEVRIQTALIDEAAEGARLKLHHGIGAIASFAGLCRNSHEGAQVAAMELEHYPGMTERSIESMLTEARARFDLQAAVVIHRVGPIALGECIVWVASASAHRHAAFQATEFLMDYLKTQAPFWKRESLADGSSRWVDARSSDDAALERWGIAPRNS